jgi:DNA repair protein RadC
MGILSWIGDKVDSAIDIIKNGVARLGRAVTRLIRKIINFFRNIVGWFKDKARLIRLKKEKNTIAVAIKEKLQNGEYETYQCLFDDEKNEVLEAQVITCEELDAETKAKFNDKDMLVLS